MVVPVYYSAGTLPRLIEEIHAACSPLGLPFEVILVNDGSQDESWAVIERLNRERDFVVGIDLMRNSGQHNALLCGIRAARYALTCTIDDDLQNPPSEIPRLVEALNDKYDVCYGTPEEKQHSLWRSFASFVIRQALYFVMGSEVARHASSFRLFRTELRESFQHYQGSFVSIDVLLSWGTKRFTTLAVLHRAREEGRSNYNFAKLANHAIDIITGFSVMPLRLASFMGFALTVFGILVLIYVVGRYLIEGGSVPGFPFVASIVAIFSGAQLFSLGIIGEYLARIHFRVMNQPTYTIRQTTRQTGEQP